jgi:hypothetical protein
MPAPGRFANWDTRGKPQNKGSVEQMKRSIPYVRNTPVRIPVALFEIGTIVSYQGRLYVVLGVTPMSVRPALLELEDTENGSIRRVRADDAELVVVVTKRPPAGDA